LLLALMYDLLLLSVFRQYSYTFICPKSLVVCSV
jgi:hypothetical protein